MTTDALPIGERLRGTTPARVPERRELLGEGLLLRPVDPEHDAEPLYRASHGSPEVERLWTYMAYGPFPDVAAMGAWLHRSAESTDTVFLTVAERTTGERLGMASFLNAVPEMKRIEIGHIWYPPRVWGSGVNREATAVLLREAFETLGYRRVEWKCDALNQRSRAAALSLGFAFEGVFRQHMIVKGRNRDTAWYAMLDRDWPEQRARLRARLPAR